MPIPSLDSEHETSEYDPPYHVHCECAVLVELHKARAHQHTVVPYIGVSKPPCAFCDLFFSAYREVTRSAICTQTPRGNMSSWTMPTLPPDDRALLDARNALRDRLRAKIRAEARDLEVEYARRGWDPLRAPDVDAEMKQAEAAKAKLDGELDVGCGLSFVSWYGS